MAGGALVGTGGSAVTGALGLATTTSVPHEAHMAAMPPRTSKVLVFTKCLSAPASFLFEFLVTDAWELALRLYVPGLLVLLPTCPV